MRAQMAAEHELWSGVAARQVVEGAERRAAAGCAWTPGERLSGQFI